MKHKTLCFPIVYSFPRMMESAKNSRVVNNAGTLFLRQNMYLAFMLGPYISSPANTDAWQKQKHAGYFLVQTKSKWLLKYGASSDLPPWVGKEAWWFHKFGQKLIHASPLPLKGVRGSSSGKNRGQCFGTPEKLAPASHCRYPSMTQAERT